MEINVNINDFYHVDRIYTNNPDKDIMEYLENNRYVNNSIFGMYNNVKNELYVIRSNDEYEIVSMANKFIKRYGDNLSDLKFYAVVISSYAMLSSKLIDLEYKFLKEKTSGEKSVVLVKKI